MSVRGRVQRQDQVIHVVAERFTDLSFWLRQISEREEPFPLSTGRADEAKHGGSPDHRDPLARPSPGTGDPERSSSQEAQGEGTTAPPVQVKARNFR